MLRSGRKTFIIIVFFLLLFSETKAQIISNFEDDLYSTFSLTKSFGKQIIRPQGEVFWAGGGILVSSLFDRSLRKIAQKNGSSLNDLIFKTDRFYGEKNILLPVSAGLYIAGLAANQPYLRKLGLKSTQALIFTGVLTIATKEILGRARPFQDKGPFKFKPFSFQEQWRSFPSGHAALSFAFSTIMAKSVNNIFWKIGWYGAAFTVAGARMYRDKHWLSDVLAGGLVGWSVATFVWNFDENSKDNSGDTRALPSLNIGYSLRGDLTFNYTLIF